tara:strand:- start:10274 stop:11125 length:852 start_codon:yes stop_codon:yes gene_type:complete
MPEKVIAEDINDATSRVGELFHEAIEEFGDPDEAPNPVQPVIDLGQPIHVSIECPEQSTNCEIAHNPVDVLVNALAVLSGCVPGRKIEDMLGRPFRPVRTAALLPVLMNQTTDLYVAGHFSIAYAVVDYNGLRLLDAEVCYETAEVYEFLVEDFATVSICMQAVARNLGIGVGHLRINVEKPTCLRENLEHFNWMDQGQVLGTTSLVFGPLITDGFMRELGELLEGTLPIGMQSSFLRRAVIPAILILEALNNDKLAEAKVIARSLPANLEWTVAVTEFLKGL